MRKILKKFASTMLIVTMMLPVSSVMGYAGNEIVTHDVYLNGIENGLNSMVGTYTAPTQNGRLTDDYKYLGWCSFMDLVPDGLSYENGNYRFLIMTYTGDITNLRFEFTRIGEAGNGLGDEKEGPFWFNPEGHTHYFVAAGDGNIPLVGNNTTVVIDLSRTVNPDSISGDGKGVGIDWFNSGIHMHCSDMVTHGNGKGFTISQAYLTDHNFWDHPQVKGSLTENQKIELSKNDYGKIYDQGYTFTPDQSGFYEVLMTSDKYFSSQSKIYLGDSSQSYDRYYVKTAKHDDEYGYSCNFYLQQGKEYEVSAVGTYAEGDISMIIKRQENELFSVSVDGHEVAKVAKGSDIEIPKSVLGYYADGKLYEEGTKYPVSKNVDLKELKVNVNIGRSADIKYTQPAALRFKAKLTCDNEYMLSSVLKEAGMLITRSDYVDNLGELNLSSKYGFMKVKSNGWYNSEIGKYFITLSGIKKKNNFLDYKARAYAILQYSDGTTKTVYSNYSNPCSVAEASYNVIKNKAVYDGLSDDYKAILNENIE